MRKSLLLVLTVLSALLISTAGGVYAQEADDFVIVKYGKLFIETTSPGAKVYVDDEYRGPANTLIEKVLVGEHTISCRTDVRSVTDSFLVKKNETLKLDALLVEGKLIHQVVPVKAEPPKVEPEPKQARSTRHDRRQNDRPKHEKKQKKIVVEARKEPPRDLEEERRSLYLNAIKVFFEGADREQVQISHKLSSKVVTKFKEKDEHSGKYYRTKSNILLCDKGPCIQQWSASFVYTDEKNNEYSFGLTWKQTVFNGMTPTGTYKRDLVVCLSGACRTLEDTASDNVAQTAELGRFLVRWSKSSLIIRRMDIMQEIVAGGGLVEAY